MRKKIKPASSQEEFLEINGLELQELVGREVTDTNGVCSYCHNNKFDFENREWICAEYCHSVCTSSDAMGKVLRFK